MYDAIHALTYYVTKARQSKPKDQSVDIKNNGVKISKTKWLTEVF